MTNAPEPGGHFSGDGRAAGEDWRWRLEAADGSELTRPESELRFTSQADAESWVGEMWHDLRDEGVDAVTLLELERVVYGPMSLHAP